MIDSINKFPNFPTETYDILYADPAWKYTGEQFSTLTGDSSGAETHYDTMSIQEMLTIPVPKIAAPNSLLFMWVVSPLLPACISLGVGWGFEFVTVAFVWNKIRKNVGFYTLSQNELCLLFKKGKEPRPRGTKNERQMVVWEREEHSKKPPEVRKRITRMYPTQKKIELFARTDIDGWDCWGNETGKFDPNERRFS